MNGFCYPCLNLLDFFALRMDVGSPSYIIALKKLDNCDIGGGE